MSTQEEVKFGGIEFAYIAIFFALVILGGMFAKVITPQAARIGIFAWGVVGHAIVIPYMIIARNTNAAIVLFAFIGFWISVSLALGSLPSAELNGLLIMGEIGLILFLTAFQTLYAGELKIVLIVILAAVIWLLLVKFVAIPGIATAIMLWAIALGLLLRATQRLKKAPSPSH